MTLLTDGGVAPLRLRRWRRRRPPLRAGRRRRSHRGGGAHRRCGQRAVRVEGVVFARRREPLCGRCCCPCGRRRRRGRLVLWSWSRRDRFERALVRVPEVLQHSGHHRAHLCMYAVQRMSESQKQARTSRKKLKGAACVCYWHRLQLSTGRNARLAGRRGEEYLRATPALSSDQDTKTKKRRAATNPPPPPLHPHPSHIFHRWSVGRFPVAAPIHHVSNVALHGLGFAQVAQRGQPGVRVALDALPNGLAVAGSFLGEHLRAFVTDERVQR